MRDHVQGRRCQVRAGSDVGGKPSQQLPHVRRADVALDRLLHCTHWIHLAHITRGNLEQPGDLRRLVVNKNWSGDAVDLRGVRQEALVAFHIPRRDPLDLLQRGRQVAVQIELCAIRVKVAGQRVDGFQGQVISQVLPGSPEQLFEHRQHGDHRWPAVPAESLLPLFTHLPADLFVLF